jgi:PPOX class probable F420-dependent enzyme
VLGTTHPERGVDAVPVCFAVAGDALAVPVDAVKPKGSPDLQRRRNLEADPRAVLLCEHWDPDDWTRLWWVRASARRTVEDEATTGLLVDLLGEKYRQYRERPFHYVLTFRIVEMEGWSADVRPALS